MTMMETQPPTRRNYTAAVVVLVLAMGLVLGGGLGYIVFNGQVSQLQQQVQALQTELQNATSSSTGNSNSTTVIVTGNVSVSQLYAAVKNSVVVITGMVSSNSFFGQSTGEVQGSGFAYSVGGQSVIVTNFHVIDGATGISVTFSDGNAYPATVIGTDQYSDLAVLSVQAPSTEFVPLTMVSSTTLSVGDPVMAVGAPYGLTGSVTTGVVSALGRTISESTVPYAIANAIQTSAPINPGNSGGPLLNYADQVVGITTATATDSSGNAADAIGFAVPSSTILREIGSLVSTGSYTQHAYMGITEVDMDYAIAQASNVSTTYGVMIQSVVSGGPASSAGLKAGTQRTTIEGSTVMLGGDIVTAINGTRVLNSDGLSAYLEANTLPGQTLSLSIIRGGQSMTLSLVLGTRPAPGS
ncbi:MAG TPA: trypsin-like peptidase domain-containing protein [Conexivisphaerales archaeon]|nr:trypsin-like peptidase domain-containing protein [Conexivisphaerales archaeon]